MVGSGVKARFEGPSLSSPEGDAVGSNVGIDVILSFVGKEVALVGLCDSDGFISGVNDGCVEVDGISVGIEEGYNDSDGAGVGL